MLYKILNMPVFSTSTDRRWILFFLQLFISVNFNIILISNLWFFKGIDIAQQFISADLYMITSFYPLRNRTSVFISLDIKTMPYCRYNCFFRLLTFRIRRFKVSGFMPLSYILSLNPAFGRASISNSYHRFSQHTR
jgi:hypothetical protein